MIHKLYKICSICKESKFFEEFYTKSAQCRQCFNARRTKVLSCIDCGVAKSVRSPTKRQQEAYRCCPCAVAENFRCLKADTKRYAEWIERSTKQLRKADGAPRKRRKSTYRRGESHPNWNGGKPKCECGKELEYEVRQCQACYFKSKAVIYKCLDCSATVTRKTSKRCQPCSIKWKRGANHPMWKGGLVIGSAKERNSNAHTVWSKTVLRRDDWTCQLCFKRGGVLHAHHKKRWADNKELRFELTNGVTLCRDCHLNIAHQGKWSNPPIDFWRGSDTQET